MDDRRFDAFVRSIAIRSSRRRIARGAALAAAAAIALTRGETADAYHGWIRLGHTCRHTNQCLHHTPASRRRRPLPQDVSCADNGFQYDGRLNCCRHQGGSCEYDQHCCGARHFCQNRVCVYLR